MFANASNLHILSQLELNKLKTIKILKNNSHFKVKILKNISSNSNFHKIR